MIKILHAADLHLDSPFDGLTAKQAAMRRAEQRALLFRMAELCTENEIDLVLLSGDLLDSHSAYAETGEWLCRALAQMNVPVYIAPGNHDYISARSIFTRLAFPEHVHIFTSPRIACAEVPGLPVRVWGAGFDDRYSPALLRGFSVPKEEGVIDLLCMHGELGNPESRYNPISADELARSGINYAALGHVHEYSGHRKAGNCHYAWPGCPEGRGFDETGEKGLIIAELDEHSASLRFVPLGGRRYEILRLNADVEDLEGDILRLLPEDTSRDTYRIILGGACEEAPDIAALRRALEGRFFALQIRDETRIRRDIWARAEEDTLRGLFLRRMRVQYESAGSEEAREHITQAVRWGLAALDGREELSHVDS
jgi:exonuclease SbcD